MTVTMVTTPSMCAYTHLSIAYTRCSQGDAGMGSEAFQRSSRLSFGFEASLRDLDLDPIELL